MSTVPEWRWEREQAILQWFHDELAKFAPRDLGGWDPAWEMVQPSSEAFVDALNAWKHSGTLEDQKRVQAAAREALKAWKVAALRWEQAGRPTTNEPQGRQAAHAA